MMSWLRQHVGDISLYNGGVTYSLSFFGHASLVLLFLLVNRIRRTWKKA